MKYYDPSVVAGAPKSFSEIQTAFKSRFKNPKSESQCIAELKEIKQKPSESGASNPLPQIGQQWCEICNKGH